MLEQTFKNIDNVLWKEVGCATELDCAEQTSWMLFLKYLDDLEMPNAHKAELHGRTCQLPIIKTPPLPRAACGLSPDPFDNAYW